jgi:hypothetical protein
LNSGFQQTVETEIILNTYIPIEENKQINLNKKMYVNSFEGLHVYNLPNINGESVGLLNFLTEVYAIREDNNIVNINGVDGRWVYINIEGIEGWVFNDYLDDEWQYKKRMNEIIEEKIIGEWQIIESTAYLSPPLEVHPWIFIFHRNGRIIYGPAASGYGFFGTWEVNNGMIEVSGDITMDSAGVLSGNESHNLNDIRFIDNDTVTFYNGISDSFDRMKRGIDY